MTDSSTGGYLIPADPAVPPPEPEDDGFMDFWHDVVQGITGLAGQNVRPIWQPSPPVIPTRMTDWASFGMIGRTPDQTAYEAHFGAGQGRTALVRYEDADMLHSFYGPHAEFYAIRLRDGLLIGQNREVMTAGGVGLKRVEGPVPAPVLLKEQWLYRSDLTITLRRQIRHVYPILNIVRGVGTIVEDRPPRTVPFDTGA